MISPTPEELLSFIVLFILFVFILEMSTPVIKPKVAATPASTPVAIPSPSPPPAEEVPKKEEQKTKPPTEAEIDEAEKKDEDERKTRIAKLAKEEAEEEQKRQKAALEADVSLPHAQLKEVEEYKKLPASHFLRELEREVANLAIRTEKYENAYARYKIRPSPETARNFYNARVQFDKKRIEITDIQLEIEVRVKNHVQNVIDRSMRTKRVADKDCENGAAFMTMGTPIAQKHQEKLLAHFKQTFERHIQSRKEPWFEFGTTPSKLYSSIKNTRELYLVSGATLPDWFIREYDYLWNDATTTAIEAHDSK